MTYHKGQPVTILVADDDPDDREFAREAFIEAKLKDSLEFVTDGQELIEYLTHTNGFTEASAPRPDLILLDLNMPRMDGRIALQAIKASDDLKPIPVVVLTTSNAAEDIEFAYAIGAASFITKPVTFGGLVDALRTIHSYWFELVTTPARTSDNAPRT